MKGISAVIATILLLMITIAIASTAYMYVTGMLGGMISKTISMTSSCGTDSKITLVVSNDGTVDIKDADMSVFVDNVDKSAEFDFGTIKPHTQAVIRSTGTYGAGATHTVLTVSPSNSVSQTVYC